MAIFVTARCVALCTDVSAHCLLENSRRNIRTTGKLYSRSLKVFGG